MGTIRFYPYALNSDGLCQVREALEDRGHTVIFIKKRKSKYTGKPGDFVINWGNAVVPPWSKKNVSIVNKPENITKATNKLSFFNRLKKEFSEHLPEFTTSEDTARKWAKHSTIYCRTRLTGHSGSGIVIAATPNEVVPAPLYTKRVSDIVDEYRVHVFKGAIIDKTKKRTTGKDKGMIKNMKNGWYYVKGGVNITAKLEKLSKEVCKALGLNFCALDVIVLKNDRYVFLEANTAPGLYGTTVQRYADAIEGSL